MNTLKIARMSSKSFIFLALITMLMACDTRNQEMMHGSNMSAGMGYWNWVLIVMSIGFGFLLGWLVAKRKK